MLKQRYITWSYTDFFLFFFLNCLSSEHDMRKVSSYLSVNKPDYIFMGSEQNMFFSVSSLNPYKAQFL